PGQAPPPQALLQGATSPVRRARPGGARARRPRRARPDPRAQAPVHAKRAWTPLRCGDVVLPGRVSRARALDALRHRRGVPGRGGGARLPGLGRRPPLGRAGDEDSQGPRLLRQEPRGHDGVSPEVVPRWEWRTFGDDLGDAERWFAAHESERAQESDEAYLLSSQSDASIKVRGGQLDMK